LFNAHPFSFKFQQSQPTADNLFNNSPIVSNLDTIATAVMDVGQLVYKQSELFNFKLIEQLSLISTHSIDFLETSRFIKRAQGLYLPLRLIKTNLNNNMDSSLFMLN